jgi:serine/threonine protein kinase
MTERLMNMPDHANVVQIYACYEDQNFFYTVMEPCEGGDLFDFYRVLAGETDSKYREQEVRNVVRDTLIALQYLHEQGLVHKDVKLENVCLKETLADERSSESQKGSRRQSWAGSSAVSKVEKSPPKPSSPVHRTVKIIDFDFTEEWEPNSPKSRSIVGTDGYIAPEAYLGDVCQKGDVYSVGVILFLLIAGKYPYDDSIFDDTPNENYTGSPKMQEIYDKMRAFKVRWGSAWDSLPLAMEFCKWLMAFDVEKRPTAEQALGHPWITGKGPMKISDPATLNRSASEKPPKSPKSESTSTPKSPQSPKTPKSPKTPLS